VSTKENKIATFNPDGVGQHNGNLFGLPFTQEESKIVILPVPWDVTVSYGEGTSNGPEAILNASPQLDFYDIDNPEAWKIGFFLSPISTEWKEINDSLREQASAYIRFLEHGGLLQQNQAQQLVLAEVNQACEMLHQRVYEKCKDLMQQDKVVALLGGDHSTPLGLYRALAEQHGNFGILQIDAHADLRKAYEGFTYSHASIMYNALNELPEIHKLVQVGIRDICKEEILYAQNNAKRIEIIYDSYLKSKMYEGYSWQQLCDEIIAKLPQKVHISFDIDGLDPRFCPNTGTPVPGGLEFEQCIYLFRKLIESGKKIISFDLNEVSPAEDEWDANVGARMLWKLCVFLSNANDLKP
jgi:agmatinase